VNEYGEFEMDTNIQVVLQDIDAFFEEYTGIPLCERSDFHCGWLALQTLQTVSDLRTKLLDRGRVYSQRTDQWEAESEDGSIDSDEFDNLMDEEWQEFIEDVATLFVDLGVPSP
jgi:hypothetical protein